MSKERLEVERFKDCDVLYGVEKKEDGLYFTRAIGGTICPRELVQIGAIISNEMINYCLEKFADKENITFKDLRKLENVLESIFVTEFSDRRENDSFF